MMDESEPVRQVAALPVRQGPDGKALVLLVTTLQTHRWIIPKGWPWPGENDWIAAAEEAREEAGVLGVPSPVCIGGYSYQKRRSTGDVPVQVSVYLLHVSTELDTWPEAHQRTRAWFTFREAAAAVQEEELQALLLRLENTDLWAETTG